MKDYRLIMNRLEVDYMRAMKGGCVAKPTSHPISCSGAALIESSADGAARFVMPSVLLDASSETGRVPRFTGT